MDYSIIKDLLDERNMTFKELSDILGVDRNNLYNSLTKGNPTLLRLEAVAEALCVPIWRLFTVEPKPEIYGTIFHNGQVYNINSKEDFLKIVSIIMGK